MIPRLARTRPLLLTILSSLVLFVLGVAAVRVGAPARVIVTWETVSEVGTAGFHVYRSSAPEGDFSRITESVVPAEGDPLVGATYQYADRDVAWGQRYFYRLEEVERDGTRNRFPDVVQGRAGAGWAWAMVGGAVLAALGAGLIQIASRSGSEGAGAGEAQAG